MPNIKSAKKRVLVAERNHDKNVAVKSSIKTAVKKVIEAAKNDKDKVQELLNNAYKLLDSSVSKGVLHKNTASRKKSRLTRFVNKTLAE
ncbi:MAG: 30S ribosomal protein S20 [Candidatus Gastranaerophilales bacterium]|nr:30S ribosomal protein S20 [Candidatus Gastranaerophilales bacterium]